MQVVILLTTKENSEKLRKDECSLTIFVFTYQVKEMSRDSFLFSLFSVCSPILNQLHVREFPGANILLLTTKGSAIAG